MVPERAKIHEARSPAEDDLFRGRQAGCQRKVLHLHNGKPAHRSDSFTQSRGFSSRRCNSIQERPHEALTRGKPGDAPGDEGWMRSGHCTPGLFQNGPRRRHGTGKGIQEEHRHRDPGGDNRPIREGGHREAGQDGSHPAPRRNKSYGRFLICAQLRASREYEYSPWALMM